ncbi:MAG TPA: PKD domain-containing protein, partial [Flavobacteriales bacterium]|nr:PKD domain-containing protein [Flavobacteriales bacterium]
MMRSAAMMMACVLAITSRATHIIGGEMYYDHLGGNQYQVTLKLYRDCGPDNVNGTGFDLQAQIAVYDAAGTLITSQLLDDPGEITVPVVLNDPCLTAPPTICVATTQYVGVFDLPPITGGYTLSYQRCCRTPAMINLQGQMGLTCTIHVPAPPNNANSSPRFNTYPPIALCLGEDISIDHSATDPDGDQLVYSICPPLQGADALNPAPLAPPPPYSAVAWAPGYSDNMQIDSSPPLSIDPVTGELTLHPTLQGSFAVAVCVSEYRNGVLLGETRRDFKFNVVVCNAEILAIIAEQNANAVCDGLDLTFVNNSVNGSTWFWDFGVPGVTSDTSDLEEPTFTFPGPGLYTVTLVAGPGLPCADTSSAVYEAYPQVYVDFVRPAVRCPNQLAELVATGVFSGLADIQWDFGSAGIPSSASGIEVSTAFASPGVYPVQVTVSENGCVDSYVDSVVVFPRPTVDFTSDTHACVGEAFAFQNLCSAWTPLHMHWDLGDGTTAVDSALIHIYTEPGLYTVSLTANTDSGCIAEETLTRDQWVEVFPKPVAAFTALPGEVSLMDPRIEVLDYSSGAVDWYYLLNGEEFRTPDFQYEFEDG